MKLLYASSLTFPSGGTSNRLQSLNMVKAFNKRLKNNFYFGFSKVCPGSEPYMKYLEDLDKNRLLEIGEGRSYFLAKKYLKLIRKNKIGYVYCREPRLLFFLIFYSRTLFWRFSRVKFIFEIHIIPKNSLGRFIHKALFRWVDYFLFITSFLRDFYIKNYNCPKSKSLVVPDGVDLEVFDLELSKEQARKKTGLPLDKKIIGYFGRFKTMGMDKGLGMILECLRFLNQDVLFLAMGGKPSHIEEYKNKARELAVGNKVLFIRQFNQNEVALHQKACDVLLVTYPFYEHYAFYMSPAKMFEHMASKRPIVASDLPAVKEILNENSAFFSQPDNPDDLAEAIKKVLASQEQAQETAEQAFEDVQRYTWQKRVDNILEFLQET